MPTNIQHSNFDIEPTGIAYVGCIDEYLVITNTSHNTEISELLTEKLLPKAIYNHTKYLDHLDKAAFDLDMHAIFVERNEQGKQYLLMLNHFGCLKYFDVRFDETANGPIILNPVAEQIWLGDVEQTLLINGCLVSSSPCGYYTDEPSKPGLYISVPIWKKDDEWISGCNKRLEYEAYFTELGIVTAIAVNKPANLLAIAFKQNVYVYKIKQSKNRSIIFDELVCKVKVDFYARYLSFLQEKYLFCAGHDINCTENVDDTSILKGGGFLLFDYIENEIISAFAFGHDLAWGNGGICVTTYPQFTAARSDSQTIKDVRVFGLDRQANLIGWSLNTGKSNILFNSEGSYSNLGIAHVVLTKESIICGFNRGGAVLHIYYFANNDTGYLNGRV